MIKTPDRKTVVTVLNILSKTYTDHPMHEAFKHNAVHMLIAVVLSQRATDAMTIPVAKKLFEHAPTARDIMNLPQHELESIIRPIGFFHAKAAALKKLCAALAERHHGEVPHTEQELLALPQVGRKTANIMLTLFFKTPQIAVDIHVDRITHRLGWVRTKTPEQTEKALTDLIPPSLVHDVNRVFVRHGQETCRPLSPWCSRCPIRAYCPRIGVTSSR